MKFGSDIVRPLRDIYAGRHEPEGLHLLSDLYWRTILSAALIVVVAVAAYGVWDLLKVLDDLASAADTSAPPPPALNRAKLEGVVHAFEMRQVQFDALKAHSGGTIPDPSR